MRDRGGRRSTAATTPAATPVVHVVAVWLLGLTPAVVLPGALNPFVLPKLTLDAVAVGFALCAPAGHRLTRRAQLVLLSGLGVLALAAALGAAPVAQLIGRAPRYEGVVALGVYASAVVVGARLIGGAGALRTHLLRASTIAVTLVAVLGLVQSFGLATGGGDVSRPGSLLGNATEQGAYGVVVLGLALGARRGSRDHWSTAAVVAGVVAVATSASRGALLGLVVAILVVAVTGSATLRRTALGGLAAAVALAAALPLTRDRLLLLSPLSRQTVDGRWLEWQETLRLVVDHPLLGVGPSGFVTAIPARQSVQYVRLAGADRLDSPHSWPLQVAVAGGAVLLLVALTALLLLMDAARRRWGGSDGWVRGVCAALAGWGTVLLTHFTAPGSTPLVALLAGSLLAAPVLVRRPHSWRCWPGAGLAGLAAVVLALAAAAEVPLRAGLAALADGRPGALADLALAHRLRPWDRDLDAQAAHALVLHPPAAPVDWSGYVDRALDAFPTDPAVLVDAALSARLAGRPEVALVRLDRAHELAPYDAEVLVARGRQRAAAGQLDGAVADLVAAASLRPVDPLPEQLLAAVYLQQGRDDLARRAADRARVLGGP